MRILVSGSTGMVGSALVPALLADGHQVVRLVRREPRAGEVRWDPPAGEVDADGLRGIEGVVHLAGENIASGRWTADKKARIRSSRVDGTALLCRALAEAPPRVFVGASAIGYYGSRGDEVLHESSPPGDDFLAEVCVAWEAASDPLAAAGCRVVRPRIGVVLGTSGGALARMLPIFKLGVGGKVGSGRQFMSWITLDDVVGVLRRALADETMSGACNATAPAPVRNAAFTRALGARLHRPTILPAPGFALRLVMGEMADALLLSSTRAVPTCLLESGHEFRHPEIDAALGAVLSRG